MKKILIAEDDVTMGGLLTTLLKMEGYQVTVLGANADIVQAVDENKPDILLMDVHLFHLNGIDELIRLRESPGGKAVPVLMTSGLDFKKQSMEHGANGFIQKPFMPDELINALRSMG
jgi:DNA-binding response OmpR family regulator